MNIFLDDQRNLNKIYPLANPNEYVVLRTYHQFINYIQKFGLPFFISFDHDLSMEHTKFFFENGGHENPPDPLTTKFREKTGYDAAKWLINYCLENKQNLPQWYVHSHNPIGSENIRNILKKGVQ